MIETSQEFTEVAKALVEVQKVLQGAKKDSLNPFHKSKYADLTSVWEACREPLTANGLSVVQTVGSAENGYLQLTTMLLHTTGQFVRDTLVMKLKEDTPQGVGSAITYARRYALASIVGVCPEDDDGESATRKASGAANARAAFVPPVAPQTPKPAVAGNIVTPVRN